MRKLFVVLVACVLAGSLHGQVFNTGQTLRPGNFSLGLNPVFFNDDLGLFLHGGIGIKSGIDLGIRYGVLDGEDYFGADLEWRLVSGKPSVSLMTGGHVLYNFGLDFMLNVSFPIRSDTHLYSGLDSDIIFGDNDTHFLLWLPIGLELKLRRSIGFILEGEIPLTDPAYGIFGGGVAFYF
jgi:hypothetical protein